MKLNKFHTVIKNTPEDVREDIRLSMHILDRINELLHEKFDGKQKLLAEKLGKSEAEVSKWFNGVQNFTTKTLVKLSIAFGGPIIAVCTGHENATFQQVKVPYSKCHTRLIVDKVGAIEEKVQYQTVKKIDTRSHSVHNSGI